ncbi:hypothetical protein [Polynucleobacter sp.]|uniref:hypothetical protein n=1 Tax=Polynucleobacter sp. TaxID=2029855 RepID=UPI003F69C0A8
MKNKKEVFCFDCKYLGGSAFVELLCLARPTLIKTPIEKYNSFPSISDFGFNEKNDCNLYKRVWWKFWVK